ncbi:proton-conducting transporter membrane subunit [uncultured Meiothermus sp.]|uniref:complex I subunit 5 family protein n=1 Tax=uncultured Meiothermus sp. TaxID=157471 RepID=UPI002605FBD8|nr:proton-conducting transporter membrane subunit [uncultured Meiothermus sp.]
MSELPWIVWAVLIPLAGAVLAFLWPAQGARVALLVWLGTGVAVLGLSLQLIQSGVQRYAVGGWHPPLGISLHADGLSTLMLLLTALVFGPIMLYALAYFKNPAHPFWALSLFLWTALNALFVSGDVFNVYVSLELLGLSAVALTALGGQARALVAAYRYLLASLLGSLVYLLGVGLLYAEYATLDLQTLGRVISLDPASAVALALMTTGLLLKTALFPLHFWLPPAHASATAPVSALLSGLVVKGSLYLLLRLWLEVFPTEATSGLLLGLLGAGAVFWGSLYALRARELKPLIAYSTVAQLGYPFLAFPMLGAGGEVVVVYFVLSHAFAKAAMFLAAGSVLLAFGHDRLSELRGLLQSLPLSVAAFALAGTSLMGLPPSGGFVAKWLLLQASIAAGQWLWAVVALLGGLLSAGYVFRILTRAIADPKQPAQPKAAFPMVELVALALAIVSVLLGFLALPVLRLLEVGR